MFPILLYAASMSLSEVSYLGELSNLRGPALKRGEYSTLATFVSIY
jgi:hypothetical protein